MKTFQQTTEDGRKGAQWHIIDARGVPLGRLASRVAQIIRGKHKPTFTPHVDGGDFVIVKNAAEVALTGAKLSTKRYQWHTGFIGGIKEKSAEELLKASPRKVLEKAVQGMLPGGTLGHRLIGKLKVYNGEDHPHVAQQPKVLTVR